MAVGGVVAGAEAGFAAGVAAGAVVVVVAAGAAESATAAFFDLEDFLEAKGLLALEAEPAVASADSVFLLFLDLLPLEVSAEADAVLSAASDFFDFDDFLVVEVSAAAELSAASDFLDFEDFLVVDVSAAVELSAASDFFDFEDFLAVEVSAAAASVVSDFLLFLVDFLLLEASAEEASCASAFFFLDLDLEAVVSLWSVELCAACPAAACRTTTLAPNSSKADSNARQTLLRVRFMLDGFLSRCGSTSPCRHTQDACFGWVTGEKQANSRRPFLVEWQE